MQIEDTARDEGDNLRLQIILGHRIGWVYAEGDPDEGPLFEVLCKSVGPIDTDCEDLFRHALQQAGLSH